MSCSCKRSRAAKVLADHLAAIGDCPPGECRRLWSPDAIEECDPSEEDLAACWIDWADEATR